MNRSPADVLAEVLVDSGVGQRPSGSVADWKIYVGSLPDEGDQAVLLVDTQPLMDGRIHEDGETIQHPGIEIVVRALDHTTAWLKSNIITSILDGIAREDVTVGADTYTIQAATHKGIMALGMERRASSVASRRHLFSINVICSMWQN